MLRLFGRSVKLDCFVCRFRTGSASTTSSAIETPTAISGRRIDLVMTKPHSRDSCRFPFKRCSTVGVSRSQTSHLGCVLNSRKRRRTVAASTWRTPRSM